MAKDMEKAKVLSAIVTFFTGQIILQESQVPMPKGKVKGQESSPSVENDQNIQRDQTSTSSIRIEPEELWELANAAVKPRLIIFKRLWQLGKVLEESKYHSYVQEVHKEAPGELQTGQPHLYSWARSRSKLSCKSFPNRLGISRWFGLVCMDLWWGKLGSWSSRNQVLHLGRTSSRHQDRLGTNWLKSSLAEKDVVSWGHQVDLDQQCDFVAKRPMASWAALGGTLPADWGRWFFPAPQPWWHTFESSV